MTTLQDLRAGLRHQRSNVFLTLAARREVEEELVLLAHGVALRPDRVQDLGAGYGIEVTSQEACFNVPPLGECLNGHRYIDFVRGPAILARGALAVELPSTALKPGRTPASCGRPPQPARGSIPRTASTTSRSGKRRDTHGRLTTLHYGHRTASDSMGIRMNLLTYTAGDSAGVAYGRTTAVNRGLRWY